ncbi:MAG: hypothetical protein J1E05_08130 [Eubacterium sp.]|nr:hypothetical protein [Eubacterium sp.]
MFFHEDWLMRQIEMLVAAILNAILSKRSRTNTVTEEENTKLSAIGELLDKNEICEAENLIFALADEKENDIELLNDAVKFYQTLNGKSEEFLNAHDFSHEEIKEGLGALCSRYDIFNDTLISFDFENDN